ncbi:unnamed protein product [Closterium sp. Naga37s-1]|nr:unnamed protein product [Closterium sp. Naga37s-1]
MRIAPESPSGVVIRQGRPNAPATLPFLTLGPDRRLSLHPRPPADLLDVAAAAASQGGGGKRDVGKADAGKGDADAGNGDAGKGGAGKEDVGKGDAWEGDAGKGEGMVLTADRACGEGEWVHVACEVHPHPHAARLYINRAQAAQHTASSAPLHASAPAAETAPLLLTGGDGPTGAGAVGGGGGGGGVHALVHHVKLLHTADVATHYAEVGWERGTGRVGGGVEGEDWRRTAGREERMEAKRGG